MHLHLLNRLRYLAGLKLALHIHLVILQRLSSWFYLGVSEDSTSDISLTPRFFHPVCLHFELLNRALALWDRYSVTRCRRYLSQKYHGKNTLILISVRTDIMGLIKNDDGIFRHLLWDLFCNFRIQKIVKRVDNNIHERHLESCVNRRD